MTTQPVSVRIIALFNDYRDAARAYHWLQHLGHNKNDISLLMSDTTAPRFHAIVNDDRVEDKVVEPKGSYVSGVMGATVGAGLVATIATGLGLLTGGPFGAALAASIPGAMVGGLVGGLVGYGFPKELAEHFEKAIQQGGVVLGITLDELDQVEDIEQQLSLLKGSHITVVR